MKVGKEAEEDPLGRLTRCYRGVCRGMLCYWSVKRTLMNASPTAQLRVPCKTISEYASRSMYYLSRVGPVGRPSLPRDYRENPGFAWILPFSPSSLPLGEIDRLRENGRMMLYDDHREDTVTTALTATLHGVKDGVRAVITLDFFPAD